MDWTRRQLEAIVTIAERQNITHAAVELSLTQPTVSRMLARIEDSLDTQLFVRESNGVVPTEAGTLLISRANEILRSLDETTDAIRSLDGRLVGKVCVAMPDTTAHTLLIPLIDHFAEQHPDVEIRVMTSHPSGVPLTLQSGDADVGIVSSAHRQGDMPQRRLVSEKLHLVGATGTLGGGSIRPVPLEFIARQRLVLPAIQPGLRNVIEAAFGQRQIRPNVVLEVDAEDALIELISSGRAMSIMSFAGVLRHVARGALDARPIDDPPIERILCTVLPTNRQPTRLMNVVRDAIHTLAVDLAPSARWEAL